MHIDGKRPSGLAEPLSEKQESARGPVPVGTGILVETEIGGIPFGIDFAQGQEIGIFIVASAADVELRFKQDRGILTELMFESDPEAVAVAVRHVLSVVVIYKKTAVIHVRRPRALLFHVSFRPAVHIVAVQFHVAVQ